MDVVELFYGIWFTLLSKSSQIKLGTFWLFDVSSICISSSFSSWCIKKNSRSNISLHLLNTSESLKPFTLNLQSRCVGLDMLTINSMLLNLFWILRSSSRANFCAESCYKFISFTSIALFSPFIITITFEMQTFFSALFSTQLLQSERLQPYSSLLLKKYLLWL